jgi:hypothetical protein
MDLILPGRDMGPEDFEAQAALRTLLEADKLKHCGDEELLSRVAEQIEHNVDTLNRVAALVESLRGEGEDDGELDESDDTESLFTDTETPGERTDTRDIHDFLRRANRARKKENRKTEGY